jgi:hypothetical protein
MKTLSTIIIILISGFLSCKNDKTKNSTISESKDSIVTFDNGTRTLPIQDTIGADTVAADNILADDYPVTNEMFIDKNPNSSYKIKSGEIFSLDKVWFTNDTLNQTLVFELSTDYHRFYIYHLLNSDIPSDLIKHIQLDVSKSKFDNVFDTATFEQKQSYFRGFIDSAININQSYFTTNKGFKLGVKKEKAISIYGDPDRCTILDRIEKCEWKFEGDYSESEEKHPRNTKRPYVKNSFGFSVTMYFRSDLLIGMILTNDIP